VVLNLFPNAKSVATTSQRYVGGDVRGGMIIAGDENEVNKSWNIQN